MKRFLIITAALLAMVLCCGCRDEDAALDTNKFYIYFREAKRDSLYPLEAEISKDAEPGEIVGTIWKTLSLGPDSSDYISPIPRELSLKNFALDGDDLIFNFESDYYNLMPADEILLRAALVRTFCQFTRIGSVEIRVEEQPLVLMDGTVVTSQKATDFVDLFGSGLNAFNEAEITLYFPLSGGDALGKTTKTVNYRTSQSLESVAARMLFAGPDDTERFQPPFPADVKLLSVTTKNDVCTVNIGTADMSGNITVLPDVMAYSLVDTITEMSGISSVQILVNGKNTDLFFEALDISKPLYRDLDYVRQEAGENAETEEPASEGDNK